MCSAGFAVSLGFACWRYAGLWSFWPLALVQQAQAAIVFVVLRRLGGAVLFRSSCPSPNPSYRFWLLVLTFRSSRPAFCGRLTSPVSLRKIRIIQAMQYPSAFTFSSVYPLVGVLPCAGLRLGVRRWFQAFLASRACAACATSYHFASIAPPPWRCAFSRFAPVVNSVVSVLASGSNCAVKPTRLRRAAYFRR